MIVYGDRQQRASKSALLEAIAHASDETERLIRQGQLEAALLDGAAEGDSVTVKIPEGFAWYGVYPEQYLHAARRFVRECLPHAAVVIGIRSIGTTLSTVVADALDCPVWRFTVRPEGHPFDRVLALPDELKTRIRNQSGDWFLIVDEGPGLSGSSFASVAEALHQLGIPDDRIVLFPSYHADPANFVSNRARERWNRHQQFAEPFAEDSIIPKGAQDLSGGKWRALLGVNVDIVESHERRKYLAHGTLWKFAGLAHLGRAKLRRAEALEGFVPRPVGFENGFLLTEWLTGEPVRIAGRELASFVSQYIEHVRCTFPTAERVRYAELRHMIEINTGVVVPERLPEIEEQPVVELDGRMLPHEWLRTANGFTKTDALDHHDDHFFPGCQPIDWDIAGAAVELGIEVRPVHSFWKTAYLAYRIGYTGMFGQERLNRRYRAALEEVASGFPRSSVA